MTNRHFDLKPGFFGDCTAKSRNSTGVCIIGTTAVTFFGAIQDSVATHFIKSFSVFVFQSPRRQK